MTTTVSSVTSHFPSAEDGFTTTLSSTISAGATTVGLNSVAGYANGEVAVMVVAPTVASEKQVFTGIVDTSGIQLTGVKWTTGTNQTHAAGTTVVDYATATHISMMSKGLLVEHDQDGTHKAITTPSVTATGAVTGATGVFSGNVTDRGTILATQRQELSRDCIVSGGVWSGDAYASTRNASMTALVCYINGQRGTISAVTARNFTASKDTYIDVLNTAGVFTLVYTEVANNAASPALASNSIRLGIVVTGATNIASASYINQGQPDRGVPSTTNKGRSGTDSNGIRIKPISITDPYSLNPIVYTANSSLGNNTTSYSDAASVAIVLPYDSCVVLDATAFGMWQGAPAVTMEMQILANAAATSYTRVDVYTNNENWSASITDQAFLTAGSYTIKIQTRHSQGGSSFVGSSLKVMAFRV